MTATLTKQEKAELRAQVVRAQKLSDTFLICRLVGHAWDRIMPDREPMFGRIVVWQCARCTSKRDDILQADTGQLLQRSYRYVEGYLVKKSGIKKTHRGGRMFSAGALRVALLRRDDQADAAEAIDQAAS